MKNVIKTSFVLMMALTVAFTMSATVFAGSYEDAVKKQQQERADNAPEDNSGWVISNSSGSGTAPAKPSTPSVRWIKNSAGKWIVKVDGKQQKGWFKDTVKYPGWYYFDMKTGIMKTGWFFDKSSKAWYYLKSSGEMSKGWEKVNGKWYYMNSSGKMMTGKVKISNKFYYFNSKGVWVR